MNALGRTGSRVSVNLDAEGDERHLGGKFPSRRNNLAPKVRHMPSLKSHVVATVLRYSRKRAFASADNLNRWIRASRKRQNHAPPVQLTRRLYIEYETVSGFPVYDVRPSGETDSLRILYLHGGAYVFEITRYHWRLIAEMADRLGARVTVPIYPIAPEHDFHAMFGMVMNVYRAMLAETPAQDIAFMGDSRSARNRIAAFLSNYGEAQSGCGIEGDAIRAIRRCKS
jgi:acetyl esterase/lipase